MRNIYFKPTSWDPDGDSYRRGQRLGGGGGLEYVKDYGG
jgi:hypothetical protein